MRASGATGGRPRAKSASLEHRFRTATLQRERLRPKRQLAVGAADAGYEEADERAEKGVAGGGGGRVGGAADPALDAIEHVGRNRIHFDDRAEVVAAGR